MINYKMSCKTCDKKGCVSMSKTKYNNMLIEIKALKEKIEALEMGKLPVQKFSSSDSYSSGDFESIEDVEPVVIPRAARGRGGKKKGKKSKKGENGKTKKKTRRRMRG